MLNEIELACYGELLEDNLEEARIWMKKLAEEERRAIN